MLPLQHQQGLKNLLNQFPFLKPSILTAHFIPNSSCALQFSFNSDFLLPSAAILKSDCLQRLRSQKPPSCQSSTLQISRITHIVNQISSLGSCLGEIVTLGGTRGQAALRFRAAARFHYSQRRNNQRR